MSTANDRQVAGSHYKAEVQHWDLVAALGLNYFEGQITKYVTRHRKKNGIQDLEKAMHFAEKWNELRTKRGLRWAEPVLDAHPILARPMLGRYLVANDIDPESLEGQIIEETCLRECGMVVGLLQKLLDQEKQAQSAKG